MTKELFLQSIKALENQHQHDRKCARAFRVILPDDHISLYDNHYITEQLLRVLEVLMDDKSAWIGYYMYELDFGKRKELFTITWDGKPFKLNSPEALWTILTS